MKNTIVIGKIGQETINGKKLGGRVVNIAIAGVEADKIVKAVLEANEGKLKALMFDYGLNAKAQEVMAYTPPGSVAWKEGMKDIPVHNWTAEDTEEYLETLRLYGERENAGGGFSFATRLATWEKKVQAMVDDGATRAFAEKHAGKKPVEKVDIAGLIAETEKTMLA